MTNELTVAQETELLEHMDTITAGIHTFIEVGNALGAIRDKRLYLKSHDTFKAFVEDNWDMGRSQAYRLIDAAQVAETVSPIGDIESESTARALVGIPKEDQMKAFKAASDTAAKAGRKVTAKDTKAAVAPFKKVTVIAQDVPLPKNPTKAQVVAALASGPMVDPASVPFMEPQHVAALKQVQRVREILDAWTGPYSSKPALGQAAKELVQALRGVVG